MLYGRVLSVTAEDFWAARLNFRRTLIGLVLGGFLGGANLALTFKTVRDASLRGFGHLATWEDSLRSALMPALLEQVLLLLGAWLLYRRAWRRDPLSTVLMAGSVALGSSIVQGEAYLLTLGIERWAFLKACGSTLSGPVCASIWGYALGRLRNPRGFLRFALSFVASCLLRGLYQHLNYGKGALSIAASLPLLAGFIILASFASRDLLGAAPVDHKSGGLLSTAPISLRDMREALRPHQQPTTLRWVVFSTLVTLGSMLLCAAVGVYLGRRAGVDFSTVDEGELLGMVPLAWIAVPVLVSFPASGFLIARASGKDSALEPAAGSAAAIVASLVALGLSTPEAVVFAMGFVPIAFGLSCVGAWLGMDEASRPHGVHRPPPVKTKGRAPG